MLDCERRALAAIAEYDLPIDPADYARRANAYVHFYSHVAKTRRWNLPDRAPTSCQRCGGGLRPGSRTNCPQSLKKLTKKPTRLGLEERGVLVVG